MHLKILSVLLLIPILTSCTDSTKAGAAAPLVLSSTVPTISRVESPLLIPENIPTAAVTAIWDCPCLIPVNAIHAIYHDGVLIGARYRITRITLLSHEQSGAAIQVESKRGAATQITESTGAQHRFAEHRNITNFILKNIADSWLIISSESPR